MRMGVYSTPPDPWLDIEGEVEKKRGKGGDVGMKKKRRKLGVDYAVKIFLILCSVNYKNM